MFRKFFFLPLFQQAGDGGSGGGGNGEAGGNAGGSGANAGGTNTGGSNSAAATPGANAAGSGDRTQGQPGSQSQAGANGQGQQQPSQFTYKEDRSKWLPPHRLKEHEAKVRRELQAEIDRRQQIIQQLSGATPPPPSADPEVVKAREALFTVIPELKMLVDAFGEEGAMQGLQELLANRGNLLEAAGFTWNSHGGNVLRTMFDSAAEALGIEKLSDGQKDKLFRLFKAQLTDDEEFERRYKMGDPTLVPEFVKSFVEDFIGPVRANALTPAVRNFRQPLPRNSNSRPVTTTAAKPIPVGDMDAALDRAVEYMRERGQSFVE